MTRRASHTWWRPTWAILLSAVLLPQPMLIGFVEAAPGAHGPNGEHLDAPVKSAATGLARLPDGSVNVPKLAQRRMGLRTMLAPQSETAATIELAGRVVMDPNSGGRVQPSHGGRIEPGPGGLPVAGQRVVRGQVLAYIRHHADPYAKANQQAQLTDIQANRGLAEQRVKRLESLEGTVPRKEIESARAELASLADRERGIGASLGARSAHRAGLWGHRAGGRDQWAGRRIARDPVRNRRSGTNLDRSHDARPRPGRTHSLGQSGWHT